MKKYSILLLFFLVSIFYVACQTSVLKVEEENVSSSIENKLVTRNLDFEYLLTPEYDYISDFSKNYALLVKDDIESLINNDNVIIPSTSEYEVVNIYQDKVCFKLFTNSSYGLMDMSGTIIIEPKYKHPLEFSEDLAIVEQGNKVGYINLYDELVIDYNYEWGLPFNEGLAAVGINNKFWFIDTNGKIASGPYTFLNAEVFTFVTAYMEYSEGYTAYFEENDEVILQGYNTGGYWGFIDGKGNITIPAQYLSVRPFKEGLAAVETTDKQWIYIDENGKKVMDGAPSDFSDGLACNGKEFIDKLGNIVIEIPEGFGVDASAQEGFDNFRYELIVIFKDQEYGIMDINGEIVFESKDFEEVRIFKEKLAAVKTDGKWGIIYIP